MRWQRRPEPQRHALLSAAADAAQLRLQRRRGTFSAALTELESARLVRVIEQWLQYEIETRVCIPRSCNRRRTNDAGRSADGHWTSGPR